MFPLQSQLSKHTFKIPLQGCCSCFILKWYQIKLFRGYLFKRIYLIAFYKIMVYIRQILAVYCVFCKFLFPVIWYYMHLLNPFEWQILIDFKFMTICSHVLNFPFSLIRSLTKFMLVFFQKISYEKQIYCQSL